MNLIREGQSWFIQFPKDVNLTKCKVEYLTSKVVTLRYYNMGYSVTSTFMRKDITIVEECAP
jgi:hypothetical protein